MPHDAPGSRVIIMRTDLKFQGSFPHSSHQARTYCRTYDLSIIAAYNLNIGSDGVVVTHSSPRRSWQRGLAWGPTSVVSRRHGDACLQAFYPNHKNGFQAFGQPAQLDASQASRG